MTLAIAYATPSEYRAMLEKPDVPSGGDAALEADLFAVSRYVDAKLHRVGFGIDDDLVPRRYYPENVRTLLVDDIADPTGITVKVDTLRDGSFGASLVTSDFELWPLNAPLGAEPWPYDRVHLRPYVTTIGGFACDAEVEVTAKWGWPVAVPMAIKRGTVELTGIVRTDTRRATRQINLDLGTVLSMSREAQDIIGNLLDIYWRPR